MLSHYENEADDEDDRERFIGSSVIVSHISDTYKCPALFFSNSFALSHLCCSLANLDGTLSREEGASNGSSPCASGDLLGSTVT